MQRIVALMLLCVAIPIFATAADDSKPSPEQVEFFEMKIRPILASNCFRCHGAEKQKVELRLDSRDAMLEGGETGPAIVPGEADSSILMAAIEYSGDTQIPMPPKEKLKEGEIKDIREWIDMGAPWPESTVAKKKPAPGPSKADARNHWPFRRVVDPALSEVHNANASKTAIDRFIPTKVEPRGLKKTGS